MKFKQIWGLPRWLRVCLPMQEMWVQSLGREDPLEKEMANHYSNTYSAVLRRFKQI